MKTDILIADSIYWTLFNKGQTRLDYGNQLQYGESRFPIFYDEDILSKDEEFIR